ncbi:Carboxylesterase family-domain-containing protein [Chytridium lagenaria]|nr:Carboxylesterase family-domain-containing protein [Chytridium lagenaria]
MVRFQLRSPFNVTKTKVWIHGGGFANGDGRLGASSYFTEALLITPTDGAQFVQNSNRAVIIVTMQYRLNAFGFLVTDFLRRQNRLNLGLLDQRAALEWVKKNIAVFGGDASRITAFGESAGATSIGMHLVAQNGNQNVFSSAILVSGSPTSGPRFDNYKFTDIVLQNSGCSTSSDQIACVFVVFSAQALSNLADAAVNSNYAFGPYVDGSYIPIEPGKALNLGLFLVRCRYCLDLLTNEGTVFVNRDVGNGYTSWLQNKFQTVFNLPTADVNQIPPSTLSPATPALSPSPQTYTATTNIPVKS